jgi:hypothetical protein
MRGDFMADELNASKASCDSLQKLKHRPPGVYIHVKYACREIMSWKQTVHILDIIDGAESVEGFDALITSTESQIVDGRIWRYDIVDRKNWINTYYSSDKSLQNQFCTLPFRPCLTIPHKVNLPCVLSMGQPSQHSVGIIGRSGNLKGDSNFMRAFPGALSEFELGLCPLLERIDVALVWKTSDDRDKPCDRFILPVIANRPTIIHNFYTCALDFKHAAPFRCGDAACARRVTSDIRNGSLHHAFKMLHNEVVLQNDMVLEMYKGFVLRTVQAAHARAKQIPGIPA